MCNIRLMAILLGLVGLVFSTGLVEAQQPSGLGAVVAMEKVMVDVIARAEKSVVAIARVRKERSDEVLNIEFRPDPFGRRFTPIVSPQPTDPNFVPNEYATGVVIDRRGLILTTQQVLGEDSEYFVTTSDRRVHRARVKAADPRSDLAVLVIDAGGLTPIELGDAEKLKKGQIVIALGNPYAIAKDGQVSAAWGIVSNLSRKAPMSNASDVSEKSTLHHFGTLIQTDAKLNLGTSGGPLLNLKGQMVGLITALAPAAGYDEAAGYAIPVDRTFRRVVETLKQGREVEYGFLGIQPINLTIDEIQSGLQGMRVHRVVRGTPAEKGGVLTDDIITAVNGVSIHDGDGLVLQVGRLPVEAVAKLSIVRDGKKYEQDVVLAKYPVRGRKIVTVREPDWCGMRVDYSTAVVDLDRRSHSADAVVVTDVEQGSPAWKAGFRPGDLITHVAGVAVKKPSQFREVVKKRNGSIDFRLAGTDKATVRTIASPQL